MLEYIIHKEKEEVPHHGEDGSRHMPRYALPSRYLDIQGKKVVYFSVEDADGSNRGFVVPGIVIGQEYQTKEGVPAVKVKPINDNAMQELIYKQLKIYRQRVSFWDSGEAVRKVLAAYAKV